LVDGDWVLDPRQPVPSRGAPRPVASHDSNTFGEPLTVTLSARDESDPNPRIYYTTDGSDPTPDSLSFAGSGRIRLAGRGTRTVKYFAESMSGERSDIATKTYEMTVAEVAPLIKVREGDPQPGQYDAAVTVTLEAVDDRDGHVTVHYTRDGSIPDERSPSFKDQRQFEFLEAGNHVVACYAKDRDENETYEIFHYSVRD
jgi:Chitobiase/beta-hexosaminidase C-terminal domain